MTFDEKTRFQIVALGLGIAAVVGYGLFRAMDKPQAAPVQGTTAPVAEQVTVNVSEPGKPNVSLRGENVVIAGTSGHETTLTGDPDLTFEWSIRGGTIEGESQGSTVTWTAGTGPDLVITCKATNPVGQESVVAMQVTLRPPATIVRFEAIPEVVTEGSTSKLTWTTTGTNSLILDPGDINVSQRKELSLEVAPPETTTYVLKATNSIGMVVTRAVSVKVVPKPEIISVKANPATGSPNSFNVLGEFKGGKAVLKNGATVIGSGETSPLAVRVDGLKAGASLTFTVTNEAGTYVTTSLNFSAPKK